MLLYRLRLDLHLRLECRLRLGLRLDLRLVWKLILRLDSLLFDRRLYLLHLRSRSWSGDGDRTYTLYWYGGLSVRLGLRCRLRLRLGSGGYVGLWGRTNGLTIWLRRVCTSNRRLLISCGINIRLLGRIWLRRGVGSLRGITTIGTLFIPRGVPPITRHTDFLARIRRLSIA